MPAMKARFAAPSLPQSGTLLLLAGEGPALAPLGQEADKASGGHVARAMAAAKFEGKKDQSIEVIAPGDTKLDRIIVLGAGDIGKLQPRDLELLGGTAAGLLQSAKATEAAVAAELPGEPSVKPGEVAALLASGLRLRTYGFDGYKTKKKDNGVDLKQVSLLTSAAGPRARPSRPSTRWPTGSTWRATSSTSPPTRSTRRNSPGAPRNWRSSASRWRSSTRSRWARSACARCSASASAQASRRGWR
jgi:leucyl aminopeptidase